MLSSSSLHAGHLVLSTIRILLRYLLSRMCVSLNCTIVLAVDLDNLGLLINFRNLLEGVDLSVLIVTFPHSEFLHSSCHSFLSPSLYAFFSADGLVSMGFLRSWERCSVSDVWPLAASFASSSASSLPSIPSCHSVSMYVPDYICRYLKPSVP